MDPVLHTSGMPQGRSRCTSPRHDAHGFAASGLEDLAADACLSGSRAAQCAAVGAKTGKCSSKTTAAAPDRHVRAQRPVRTGWSEEMTFRNTEFKPGSTGSGPESR